MKRLEKIAVAALSSLLLFLALGPGRACAFPFAKNQNAASLPPQLAEIVYKGSSYNYSALDSSAPQTSKALPMSPRTQTSTTASPVSQAVRQVQGTGRPLLTSRSRGGAVSPSTMPMNPLRSPIRARTTTPSAGRVQGEKQVVIHGAELVRFKRTE